MAHRLLKSLLFATVLLSFTSFAVGAEAGSGSDSDASGSPRRDATVYTALVNRETQRVNALCSYCTELASAPISPLGQAEMQIRQSAEPGYASMYAQLLEIALVRYHGTMIPRRAREKECTRIVSNVIVEDARSSLRAAQDGSFRSPGIKQEVLIAAYEQLLSDIRRETLVFTC